MASHRRDGAEGLRVLKEEVKPTEAEGNMPRRKAVTRDDLAIFEQRECANAPSANNIKHKSAATGSNFGGRMDGQSYYDVGQTR